MDFTGARELPLNFLDFFSKQSGNLFQEGEFQIPLQGKFLPQDFCFKGNAHFLRSVDYLGYFF